MDYWLILTLFYRQNWLISTLFDSCKSAWKSVHGIWENSVEKFPAGMCHDPAFTGKFWDLKIAAIN